MYFLEYVKYYQFPESCSMELIMNSTTILCINKSCATRTYHIYLVGFFSTHTQKHMPHRTVFTQWWKNDVKIKKNKSPTLFSSLILSPAFLFHLFYLSQMLNLHPWKPSDDYRVSSQLECLL